MIEHSSIVVGECSQYALVQGPPGKKWRVSDQYDFLMWWMTVDHRVRLACQYVVKHAMFEQSLIDSLCCRQVKTSHVCVPYLLSSPNSPCSYCFRFKPGSCHARSNEELYAILTTTPCLPPTTTIPYEASASVLFMKSEAVKWYQTSYRIQNQVHGLLRECSVYSQKRRTTPRKTMAAIFGMNSLATSPNLEVLNKSTSNISKWFCAGSCARSRNGFAVVSDTSLADKDPGSRNNSQEYHDWYTVRCTLYTVDMLRVSMFNMCLRVCLSG